MTKETIIKSTLKYLVKRQIEEGSVGFAVDNDPDHDCCWDDVLAWIEAQSCENAVSRDVLTEYINTKLTSNEEWASDATNEGRWVEEKKYLYGVEILEGLSEYVNDLPSVTPRRDLAETSQDCISREEVQDLISRWLSDYLLDETREALETINYKVGDMPPVKPKRPKGKWIEVEVRNVYATLKCSVCGRVIEPFFDFCKYSYEDIKRSYPYCHCGAYMGGEEDGREQE